MRQVHIRQRRDRTWGLYLGKRCLTYGTRDTIYTVGQALRDKRKERKEKN